MTAHDVASGRPTMVFVCPCGATIRSLGTVAAFDARVDEHTDTHLPLGPMPPMSFESIGDAIARMAQAEASSWSDVPNGLGLWSADVVELSGSERP